MANSRGLKLAEGEVYSQPAATGIGIHESTQLVAAVDALKPDYNVHSAADIIDLLREKYYHPSALTPQSAAAGMRVAELKESYPPARECIEELANAKPVEDREILVLRGKRDGVIKHVFWNPIRGEEVKPIDEEFKELWRSLRVPNVVDMTADLESEGLSRTKEVEDYPKVQAQQATRGRRGKAKRGAAPRKFKLQNTHLQGVDLSRDFVKQ